MLVGNAKGVALFTTTTIGCVGWCIGRQLVKSIGMTCKTQIAMLSGNGNSNSNGSYNSGGVRKKSMLYTRTGDKGTTSLYSGERRSKSDETFDCLGHQDELNAVLGIACEHCRNANNGLEDMLREIQSRLFDLGAAVATPIQSSSSEKKAYTKFSTVHTAVLEEWIDELDARLPPLTNFVIPSGGLSATQLNLARTVCRRAERAAVPLIQAGQVDEEVGKYLNRLSDFLFAATRTASHKEGISEKIWRSSQSKN